ncbi:hypothetical protein [Dehalobacter sp. TBBPA1]|uniref:DUF3102 domain-containing protein n=1 Tax=Dehalobacter sp. TBBPA1 TaxID=3235037 RepID=UPI0034A0D6F3
MTISRPKSSAYVCPNILLARSSRQTGAEALTLVKEFGPKPASPGGDLPDSNPDSNLSFSQAVILLGIELS